MDRFSYPLLKTGRPEDRETLHNGGLIEPEMDVARRLRGKRVCWIQLARDAATGKFSGQPGTDAEAVAASATQRDLQPVTRWEIVLVEHHRTAADLPHEQVLHAVVVEIRGYCRAAVPVAIATAEKGDLEKLPAAVVQVHAVSLERAQVLRRVCHPSCVARFPTATIGPAPARSPERRTNHLFLSVYPFIRSSILFASPFDASAFEAAQAAGRPVLVEVHADWCPVCTKQKPIIGELLSRPEFRAYSSFTVDFDGQKTALKRLGVQKQSTLIVYKGKREMGRSVGETDRQKIHALLEKAL